MDTELEKQTEMVFEHHLESILAKDVDAVLQGFAEDAVVFAPDGPIRGREQIRAAVNESLQHLTTKFLDDFQSWPPGHLRRGGVFPPGQQEMRFP